MKTLKHKLLRRTTLAFLVPLLIAFSFLWVGQAQAASLPAETCAYDAGTNTRTCELWAATGTISLPDGTSATIWGYASSDPALGGTVQMPGPALIASQGETVQVILHNTLSESTALIFNGIQMIPDLTGVPAGGSSTYTFLAGQPGTFLYEAGLTVNAQHQVAMGLFGALIVRPAGQPGQAYLDASTAFTDEALLVLSELDPALNNSGDPAGFDMRNYTPRYWLINGKAYPQTDAITSTIGTGKVLLRFLNAGMQPHTMNLLGLDQTLLGVNGSQLPFARSLVVNTIAPGHTADALVSIPASATADSKFAVYDGSFLTHNDGAAGFGGMLTFVTLSYGPPPPAGPATTLVSLTPSTTDGTQDVTVTATISGSLTITGAEYFVAAQGSAGTGFAMTAVDGAFDEALEDVTATLTVAQLDLLASGSHTIFVHGTDGNWGAFNSALLQIARLGPVTSGALLSPDPSNGTVDVTLSAVVTGSAPITGAEYFVDAQGTTGTGFAMTAADGAFDEAVEDVTATLTSVNLAGLAFGDHTLYVHGTTGLWGDFVTVTLHLVRPVTGSLTFTPNPADGNQAVTIQATITAAGTISQAEYFVDITGAAGTGLAMTALDGAFDETVEDVTATLSTADLAGLLTGNHTIYVHGFDGVWGGFTSAVLTLDRPLTKSIALAPNPSFGNVAVAIQATGDDTASGGSNIVAAQYLIDDLAGTPVAMAVSPIAPIASLNTTIPAATMSGLAQGEHTLFVRSQDALGNWGAWATAALKVDKTGPLATELKVTPNLLYVRAAVRLDVKLNDPLSSDLPYFGVNSNIKKAEGFINTVGADGTGFPLTPSDGLFNTPSESAYANISLATINSLPAGINTFYVHAQDSSGNWGAVASVTLEIKSENIFLDGFESGSFSAWASSSGAASVTTTAKRTGTYGMQVTLTGNTPGSAVDNSPTVEPTYRARFYFNPNSTRPGNNPVDIFVGYDADGNAVFKVQYYRTNQGVYRVRAVVTRAGGTTTGSWYTINNSWNAIEVSWQSATSAAFRLYTAGVLRQTLTGLNTSAYKLESVRLGLSSALANNATGSAYFDDFVSKRTQYIGP